jgi:serine phosphatase RsbU (regulator of sigma subunit)
LLTLATTQSRRQIGDDDVELAEQLGRRAAVAVENSRLHTKLAGVAQTLQQSLAPSAIPEIPGWEAAALYRAAQSELRIDVGGDFYEFFKHGDTWFLIVGDVTGKGVAAASTTALMRHGARVAGRAEPEPAAILRALDEVLKQKAEPSLCTAICVSLHADHVIAASAGHPPALLACGETGTVRHSSSPGPMLGAFDDAQWESEKLEISANELLVLHTDGVTETRGPVDRYGARRLQEVATAAAGDAPSTFLAELEAALEGFAAGPNRDDVAAVALRPARRTPAAAIDRADRLRAVAAAHRPRRDRSAARPPTG